MDAIIGNDHFGFASPTSRDFRALMEKLRAAGSAPPSSGGNRTGYADDAGDVGGGCGAPLLLDLDGVRGALMAQLRGAMGGNATIGATNARYVNDPHPCMPGLPDDEADVMFAALARRVSRFTNGVTAARDNEIAAAGARAAAAAEPLRFEKTDPKGRVFYKNTKTGEKNALWKKPADLDDSSLRSRHGGMATLAD